MNTEIYNRVIKCIVEIDKVDGVNFIDEVDLLPDTYIFRYFGMHECFDLMVELEKEFNIKYIFSVNDNIEDIVNTIEKLLDLDIKE